MSDSGRRPPSVGDLVGALVHETGTLVRQELHLASTEMTRKAGTAASDVGLVLAGGAIAQAGLLGVMAAVVLALSPFVPAWATALVLGLLAFAGGYSLVTHALKGMRDLDLVPRKTAESLKGPLVAKPVLEEQTR